MGTVHKFRPPPKNIGQFVGEAPRTAIFPSPVRRKPRPRRIYRQAKLALFGVVMAGALGIVLLDRLAGGLDYRTLPVGAATGVWSDLSER